MVDLSRSKRSAQVLFDTPSAFHFASKSRSASVNCLYRLILNHLPRLILGVALNYRTSTYQLIYEPSEEALKKALEQQQNTTCRGLIPDEQKRFMEAFREANKKAASRK